MKPLKLKIIFMAFEIRTERQATNKAHLRQ